MAREIGVVTGLPPQPDGGVPDFGPEKPNYRPIERRRSRPSVADSEARSRLRTSAINRALHFGYDIGDVADVQLPFPRAEHYQHFPFEQEDWAKYGIMESERSRVDFMLDRYPERSFPIALDTIAREALGNSDVLRSWKNAGPQIAAVAKDTFEDARDRMLAARKPDTVAVELLAHPNGYANAFQSDPIHYPTSLATRDNEKALWGRALEQIGGELQRGDFRNVSSFLDLYGRIKDPIAPLTSTLPSQVRIFNRLFREAQARLAEHGITDASDNRGQTLITQLALESAYLSLPSAKNIFYVRSNANDGAEHQELPYVYITLKDLPRGEFTNPRAVLPRLVELLNNAEKYGRFVVTPLAVSHFQAPGAEKPTTFLVDGNNRATAIMAMQYIYDMQPTFADRLNPDTIRAFMQKHKLHPGWERELVLTLDAKGWTDKEGIFHPGFTQSLFDRITRERKKLIKPVNGKVAALLVQETDFHNVQVGEAVRRRPQVPLLQPMHQAIYNDDLGLAMAVPPKQQTHGRAMGNYILVETEQERRWQFGSRRHRIVDLPAAA